MAHPNKWKHNLMTRYGISGEQYEEWYSLQDGKCAICGNEETKLKADGTPFNLAVDHDHDTYVVRGLLCRGCNTALGFIGDDIQTLKKTIKYLRRSRRWASRKHKAQGTSLGLSRSSKN